MGFFFGWEEWYLRRRRMVGRYFGKVFIIIFKRKSRERYEYVDLKRDV